MNEKVESGLEVVAWAVAVEGYQTLLIDNYGRALAEQEHFQGRGRTANVSPLVRQSDAERAISERDAEIQRQRERHRTTWTQLEQVTGLLREAEPYVMARAVGPMETSYLLQRIRAALSQQAGHPLVAAAGKRTKSERQSVLFNLDPFISKVMDALGSGEACGGLDGDQEDPQSTTQVVLGAIAKLKSQQAEPAPAQDEPHSLNEWFLLLEPGRQAVLREDKWMLASAAFEAGRATRPAQTEQQSIRLPERADEDEDDPIASSYNDGWNAALDEVARMNDAPIAQTAPQPEQSGPNPEISDLVAKLCPLLNQWKPTSNKAMEAKSAACVVLSAALSATPSPAMDAKEA